jgi:hypothetical protein
VLPADLGVEVIKMHVYTMLEYGSFIGHFFTKVDRFSLNLIDNSVNLIEFWFFKKPYCFPTSNIF